MTRPTPKQWHVVRDNGCVISIWSCEFEARLRAEELNTYARGHEYVVEGASYSRTNESSK